MSVSAPAPTYPPGLEAEQGLLGALLLDAKTLDRIGELRSEHFSDGTHRQIYIAIRDEHEDRGGADPVTVGERLRRNGGDGELSAYLWALAQNTPGAASAARHAELIRAAAQRRAVAAIGADLAERVSAPGADVAELLRDAQQRIAALDPARDTLELLDLAVLAASEPERPRHIVAEWLPEGEVTLLAGHGGAGKSIIALHLAVCVALGRPWHGVHTERRRVVYVSAEDRANVLHWRLARIAAHEGIALGELREWLRVVDVSDREAEMMVDPGRGEEPIITAMYDKVREQMRTAQVLILDGASDLYGANEIIRRHVRRFVRALRRLIPPDGTVLLLAHVDKAAARNSSASDRYSGSTAWHNSVRARWSLDSEPDSDARVLTLAKSNHARAGAEIRLRWSPEAYLYLAQASPTEGGIAGAIRERQEREGILAAMRACAAAGIVVPAALQGPRTACNVLAARPELPDSLRSGPKAARRFRARLEELRQIHAVIEREIRRSNRHSTLALVLADRGSAPNAPHSDDRIRRTPLCAECAEFGRRG